MIIGYLDNWILVIIRKPSQTSGKQEKDGEKPDPSKYWPKSHLKSVYSSAEIMKIVGNAPKTL